MRMSTWEAWHRKYADHGKNVDVRKQFDTTPGHSIRIAARAHETRARSLGNADPAAVNARTCGLFPRV